MLWEVAFQSRKILSRATWVSNKFWNLKERRDEFLLQVECTAGQEGWPENVNGIRGFDFL